MELQLVYIVEENRLIAEMVKFKLSLKYRIKIFETIGLFLIEMNPNVKAVIMDFNLKYELSGVDLCYWIKQEFKTPIIAISSQKKSRTLNSVKNGIVDYLDKTESTFINKLDKCLEANLYRKDKLQHQ